MLKRCAAALAASVFLCLAVLCAAWTWAELGTLSIRSGLTEHKTDGRHVSWDKALTRLHRARRLFPQHAEYSAYLAMLHSRQAWFRPANDLHARAFRASAIGYFEETLGKRPTWGEMWAYLAEARALQGTDHGATLYALEQAIRFAPRNAVVQRKAIWLGMARWSRLPEELKVQVKKFVADAIQGGAGVKKLIRMAIQYGWQNQLLPLLTKPGHAALFASIESSLRKSAGDAK